MLTDYFTDPTSVEAYIAQLADNYPALCARVPLPNPSFHGRPNTALRIGVARSFPPKRGILFTGGVHGDELGGTETCINFAESLMQAYATKSDLRYHVPPQAAIRFTASQVVKMVEGLEIFVFPLVNPDGRAAGTRVNGRRVDLARNFDFLWDEPATCGSATPADRHYRGSQPNSESETRNWIWLVDTYPVISRIVDIHTNTEQGPVVAYHWGHDDSQSDDPTMNFVAYRGQGRIGYAGDDYSEYIPPSQRDYVSLAAMNAATYINKVRGSSYPAWPASVFSLNPNTFTFVSGTPTDYFYSRQFADSGAGIPPKKWWFSSPLRRTIYGWLIEYGQMRPSNQLNPPFPEMAEITQEVNAGMASFCLDSVSPYWALFERWAPTWLQAARARV